MIHLFQKVGYAAVELLTCPVRASGVKKPVPCVVMSVIMHVKDP